MTHSLTDMGRSISIKPLRRRLGLTQKALADALGVHANTVARWERGELGISTAMVDRLDRIVDSRRSGTAVSRLFNVALDPHHQAILDGLNQRLDSDAFEACAVAVLRHDWPKLVPVRGGTDDGFDGAVADAWGEPFPLITTTGEKLVSNLSRSLDQAERKGWRPSRALFATSRRITPATRKKLFEAARARGVTLQQAYDQDWFAQRLYREPEWCSRLLGVTGRPAALSLFPVTRRPLLGDDVLGREREMRWLSDQAGDCLVVGEPGSGKTFLLRSLALQGHARFLVDDDRTQIANDVRSLRPAAVIVDDAHVDPARIAQLDQIRSEVGAKFRIIATSWPGAAAAVRSALKVGSTAELRLVRIDAGHDGETHQVDRHLGAGPIALRYPKTSCRASGAGRHSCSPVSHGQRPGCVQWRVDGRRTGPRPGPDHGYRRRELVGAIRAWRRCRSTAGVSRSPNF